MRLRMIEMQRLGGKEKGKWIREVKDSGGKGFGE